ncbi:Transcriptional regulatory protein ZraR [Fundidesulfovibrio magnetotacticus]|uniref:Transcriptional regulatory protein ZraR n=1 Tax=Fundidesulfovibrio magnetotacticus TaxID=2730080 RepID=A0A6V8LM39_9BACT|nr:sigma 54-interacting transcriptional regulator [Fundidesulfovibrio magnetotacticus]GFK93742.1 Transcriptional regulatory protein ZraR [Fundidesulfovibrio magnetotacticus]
MDNGKNLPVRLDLEELPGEATGVTSVLIGSRAMRDVHKLASQVAPSDAPVLLQGESGTGKELFARLIHVFSNRKEKPFIPVNCGVLKGELFADKFFGHEAGAFTGASRQQKGSFELAQDGTLFLDEVGEIPPANQADFLRVLEQRTFRRLGGERNLPFEARIVAATNRNLLEMVRDGRFRADLYYRLNVVPVFLPPLRLRKEDIPMLASHFIEHFSLRYHRPPIFLTPDTLRAFQDYAWPGNARELRNLIERLVLVNPGPAVEPDDLPLEFHHGPAPHADNDDLPESLLLDDVVRDAETRAIHRAFRIANGDKTRTAQLLGISPRTLRHKVQQWGLVLKQRRGQDA